NFKKFLMQNLFTQKLRFTKNNGESFPDWETKILGKLSDICTGNKDLKDNVGGGNIPSLYGLLKLNR
ncbi:MAG: hypothetical protein Q4Q23_07950, partial [Methanobacteriaceae archaeon]|nr:hypothetical protein [Methanobacteriaceae archaeon]